MLIKAIIQCILIKNLTFVFIVASRLAEVDASVVLLIELG
jgi:hypothetical protein